MKLVQIAVLFVVIAVVGAAGFIYSGVYPMGADDPHTRVVYKVVEALRDRSIARQAATIAVPALGSYDQLLEGGADYAEMCSGCHLEPGVKTSEINAGLYPQPPNLTEKSDLSAAEMFWVIKHGVKMSAMPAWGLTHDDKRMWAMLAFIQRLPELTPAQYQILTARAGGESAHHDMEHSSNESEDSHHPE